jgi:hypothetical protein
MPITEALEEVQYQSLPVKRMKAEILSANQVKINGATLNSVYMVSVLCDFDPPPGMKLLFSDWLILE